VTGTYQFAEEGGGVKNSAKARDMPDTLLLYYGDTLVASVRPDCLCVQTWEGVYESAVGGRQEGTAARLAAYIRFSEDFHRRVAADPKNTKLSECGPWDDLIGSELWRMESPEGAGSWPLDGGPAFVEGSVQWKYREGDAR
jgi:hypothetical protein